MVALRIAMLLVPSVLAIRQNEMSPSPPIEEELITNQEIRDQREKPHQPAPTYLIGDPANPGVWSVDDEFACMRKWKKNALLGSGFTDQYCLVSMGKVDMMAKSVTALMGGGTKIEPPQAVPINRCLAEHSTLFFNVCSSTKDGYRISWKSHKKKSGACFRKTKTPQVVEAAKTSQACIPGNGGMRWTEHEQGIKPRNENESPPPLPDGVDVMSMI